MRRRILGIGLIVVVVAAVVAYVLRERSTDLVLTGIVTTNDVIVSAQVAGQLAQEDVKEGDHVQRGELLATVAPAELRAGRAYYAQTAEGASAAVDQDEAALRFQQQQLENQVRQAEASLAAAQASQQLTEADLENAKLTYDRSKQLLESGVIPQEQLDQARTAYNGLVARVASLGKQVDSAKAAVALAHDNAEQVSIRRGQLDASRHQLAAAAAQQQMAEVRLGYTEVRAPIDGIVDVRAARQGEVVTVGQPIVTLINPDDLWVRVDVEESYIDRIRLGDHLPIRLPSGAQMEGTVFYRGADAGFATQRDVSRTKRDIKTFEVRLRVDNRDRRLAVGMTTYVTLVLTH